MKKLIIALTMVGVLAFAAPSFAFFGGSTHHNTTNNYDESVTNNNTNTNSNSNYNSNRNTNMNTNFNTNKTDVDVEMDQAQGQLQGQGQIQGQTAHNEGVEQNIKIENPTVFNHITPDFFGADANNVDHGNVSMIKIKGYIYKMGYLTTKAAKRASSGGSDIHVESAVVFEPEVSLDGVHWSYTSGEFMGTLTLTPEGPDVTADQMIARAVLEAGKLGATSIKLQGDYGKYLDATQYGIGFGAAGSVATASDGSSVVAPGFGTGYSVSRSANEMRPSVYVIMFHDDTKYTDNK